MGHSRVFLILALLAGALAAPSPQSIRGNFPQCSQECVAPQSQQQQQTLVYHYEGSSKFIGQHQKRSESQLKISADVYITSLGPCDSMLEIKNPLVEGQHDALTSELLSGKPLMFAHKALQTTRVCAHPDDDPVSLNFKKGILSSMQSLYTDRVKVPQEGLTVMESDILGLCPRQYNFSVLASGIEVTKHTNHKKCGHMDLFNRETMPLYGSISGFRYSNSTCRSVIENSQVKMVHCYDRNSSPDMEFKVAAVQESKITLKRTQTINPPPFPHSYRPTNLQFERVPQPLDKQFVQNVEGILKKLCSLINPGLSEEAPRVFSKLIEFLYRVPESSISSILENVRSGKYCQNTKEMEVLYLDAVGMVNNGGAVKVMVDEIVSQKASLPRKLYYALSFQTQRRPCIHAIDNLLPLFKSQDVPSPIMLGAGTMVRRYCSRTPNCEAQQPVQRILTELNEKISRCSSSSSPKQIHEQLLILKALGNMGIMSQQLKQSLVSCLESSQAPTNVRIAVSQAFRQTPCKRQPTERLIQAALGKSVKDHEVRIASYVAAIRCAERTHMSEILSVIVAEPTTQVRSFVLSHMRNLQSTDAPWLQYQKYNLSSFIIPDDYKRDMRLYSQNLDLSYYLPTMGVGAGIDTDVVFSNSYLPKMIKSNITVNMLNQVFNIAEIGLRVQDLESIASLALGPNGYLKGSSIEKIIEEVIKVIEEIIERAKSHVQQNKKLQIDSSISNILESLRNANGEVKLDMFARLFGQEVMFGSFVEDKARDIDQMIETFFRILASIIIKTTGSKVGGVNGFQIAINHFTPTIQGIPIQTKIAASFILKAEGKANIGLPRSFLDTHLSAAAHVNSFVGYSLGPKVGLRINYTAISSQYLNIESSLESGDYKIKFDIPTQGNEARMHGGSYMITKLPGRSDKIIGPSNQDVPKHKSKGCVPSIDLAGMEACYDVTIVDGFKTPYLTILGDMQMRTTLKKDDPSKPLLEIIGSMKSQKPHRQLTIKVNTSSKKQPTVGELDVETAWAQNSKSILAVAKRRGAVRAVKAVLSHPGKEYEVALFASKQPQISSTDMIMEAKVSGERSSQSLQGTLEFKTMNKLEPYLKSNIELEGQVTLRPGSKIVPQKVTIKRCEAMVEVAEKYKTVNYIRPKSSGPKMEYTFASSMMRSPQEKLYSVSGDFQLEGRLSQPDHLLGLKIEAETKHNKIETKIFSLAGKQKVQSSILVKKNSAKVFELDVLVPEPKPDQYEPQIKLELPRYDISYQMAGKVEMASQGEYDFDLQATEKSTPIYVIKGQTIYSRDGSICKDDLKLNLKSFKSNKEYSMDYSLLRSPQKDAFSFKSSDSSAPISKMEFTMKKQSQQREGLMSVFYSQIVDFKGEYDYQQSSYLKTKKDMQIFPQTQNARRIKIQSEFDLSQKKIEVRSLLDADRNPMKKLDVLAHYSIDTQQATAQLEGTMRVMKGTYKYEGEVSLPFLLRQQVNRPTYVTVSIVTPNGPSMLLKQHYQRQQLSQSQVQYNQKLQVQTFSGKKYLVSAMAKRDYQLPLSFESDVELRLPSIKSKMIVNLQKSSSQSKVLVDFDCSGPMPEISTKLEYSSSPSEKLGSLSMLYDRMQVCHCSLEHKTQEMKANIKISPMNMPEYTVQAERQSNIVDVVLSKDGKQIVEWKGQSQGQIWSAYMKLPQKQIEVESQISRGQGGLEVSGKLKQAGMAREKVVLMKLNRGQPVSKGSIMLDVFQDPSHKLEAQIDLKKINPKNYKADIQLVLLNARPRITLEGALTNETQRAVIEVYPNQSSQPKFYWALSHSKTSPISGTVYSLLKTPSRKIEFVGELQKQRMSRCLGASLNGSFVCSTHGQFDIASAVCAPGYFEVGARRPHQDSMHFVKLGMQTPSEIKLEISEVYKSVSAAFSRSINPLKIQSTYSMYGAGSWKPKRNIVYLGAKLRSPWFISLESQVEIEPLQKVAKRLIPTQQNINELSETVLIKYPNKIMSTLASQSGQLPQEIQDLMNKACSALAKLHETIASYEIMDAIQKAKWVVAEKYAKLLDNIEILKSKVDAVLRKTFKTSLSQIVESVKGAEEMLKNKIQQIKEEIESLVHQRSSLRDCKHLGWIVRKLEGSSFLSWLEKTIKELSEKFSEEIKDVVNFFRNISKTIMKDLKEILKNIEDSPIIKRIVKWIDQWLHPSSQRVYLYREILRKLSGIYITSEDFGLTLKVPMRRPVSSLRAALPSIGFPLHWTRMSHSRRGGYLLPIVYPHTKIAKVSENSVTSFDGLVIPFINSHCEILLSESQGVQILLKKPIEAQAELVVVTPQGKRISVEMKRDQKTKVPVLQGNQDLELGTLKVKKISDKQVEIDTVPFHLYVTDRSAHIEAKPNAYKQTQGLLGTHDAEIANDIPRYSQVRYEPQSAQGIHHLEKSSSRRLIQENRQDKSCFIPQM